MMRYPAREGSTGGSRCVHVVFLYISGMGCMQLYMDYTADGSRKYFRVDQLWNARSVLGTMDVSVTTGVEKCTANHTTKRRDECSCCNVQYMSMVVKYSRPKERLGKPWHRRATLSVRSSVLTRARTRTLSINLLVQQRTVQYSYSTCTWSLGPSWPPKHVSQSSPFQH